MPRLIDVDDADDPRLDAYRDVRERDLAKRRGFMAEGEVVLRTVLRDGRHGVRSVLLARGRELKLADALARLPEQTPVFTAPRPVLDAVAGFPLHRGVLAEGVRAPDEGAGALLAQCGPRALVVALFGVGNHDNMGGVFRNAAAFGADAVLLDAACCDPLYRKAIRVSVGAALTTPFARLAAGENAPALLAAHGFAALSLSPSGGRALHASARPPRAALLLGAEGPGLDADLLARTRTLAIPMAGSFDSLNLATTSGIALHHLAFAPDEVA